VSQEKQTETAPVNAGVIMADITGFVAEQTGIRPEWGQDLFETGVANSMFAMQLVVFLEQNYSVTVAGADLQLANFRTARSMAALVGRLRADAAADCGA
jgi:methoxymalonate biosynthesis acyl carrier protein